MKSKSQPSLLPRWRIVSDKDIAFGPGKAELLSLVAATGSIAQAAKRMKMSYMRAWSLVQTMNTSFKQPVVRATRGGRERGGAKVTQTGQRVLALYQHMGQAALQATRSDWRALQKLLR